MALETTVEAALRHDVESRGGMCLKVVTLNRKGFPDRLVLLPGVRPFLVETKVPGEEPEPHQARLHKKLRALGLPVVVFDGVRVL